eukprot:2412792-Prorocentrum_lima.AAC.1
MSIGCVGCGASRCGCSCCCLELLDAGSLCSLGRSYAAIVVRSWGVLVGFTSLMNCAVDAWISM